MASYDPSFRLDTDAYQQARRTRNAKSSVYWLILILTACLVAAGLAVVAGRLLEPGTPAAADRAAAPLAPAPPPAETQVRVMRVHATPSVAKRTTKVLKAAGYGLATAHAVRTKLHGTWIMYAPNGQSAALGVARRLHVPARRVEPLDGIDPSSIAPAAVLVVIGP
jgi:hypothetical protein